MTEDIESGHYPYYQIILQFGLTLLEDKYQEQYHSKIVLLDHIWWTLLLVKYVEIEGNFDLEMTVLRINQMKCQIRLQLAHALEL